MSFSSNHPRTARSLSPLNGSATSVSLDMLHRVLYASCMSTIARVGPARTSDANLTVLRHHDLRRAMSAPRMLVQGVAAPAPKGFNSEAEFTKIRCHGVCGGRHKCRFSDVARRATETFYYAGGGTNQWVFEQSRMEFGDVLQYGLTYGINFVGNYLRPPEEDADDDNEKRLHCHVVQRLQQLRAHLFKERKNSELGDTTGPDSSGEDGPKAVRRTKATELWHLMHGRTTDQEGGAVRSRSVLPTDQDSDLDQHVDSCAVCRRGALCETATELQEVAARHRKNATRRMLASGLAALTHPKAADRLREAATNEALCDDTRVVAQKMLADVEGCEGSCCLCRNGSVKGERRLRPAQASTAPPSEYPQADDLQTVRRYVADVAGLKQPFEERIQKSKPASVHRYTNLRRHAARVLQLVALQADKTVGVTQVGQELLETEPKSRGERTLLRRIVLESPVLKDVRWFFEQGTPGDFEQLVQQLVATGLTADCTVAEVGGVVSVEEVSAARVKTSVVTVQAPDGKKVRYTLPTRRLLVSAGATVTAGQALNRSIEGTARRRARTLRSWRDYLDLSKVEKAQERARLKAEKIELQAQAKAKKAEERARVKAEKMVEKARLKTEREEQRAKVREQKAQALATLKAEKLAEKARLKAEREAQREKAKLEKAQERARSKTEKRAGGKK